ncbi:MAG: acyl-CoA oxidase [Solirubrobacteraceae bacterium]|jgi:acyl-CoA oxidase|nr:acyl-CoA oxidase [Solirubrobacteraceae bacterium]
MSPTMAVEAAAADVAVLRRLLDGEHAATRDRVRETLAQPEFAPVVAVPMGEYRERILELTTQLARQGATSLAYPPEYGGEDDVGASIAGFETFAFGDLSLVVKIGVQFGLWGGAVLHLGTKRHHDAYLADTARLDLPGCFAMTEMGHGSNVQELRTTATYDRETDELVINTPEQSATKEWIGNAACHGRIAAVFCQLVVDDGHEDPGRGVHCVVVPIRDDKGRPLDGVTIADCGHKLGLNGVDNGRLAFDHVRVPRANLLDRYAQITDEGVYHSSIENRNARFFTMVSTLIQGRVCIGAAGVSVSKVALTVAIRHALHRRQFGPPNGPEVVLMDYRTHQRRLLPALATTYGLSFAQQELTADTHRAFTEPGYPEAERRKLETRASALKAMATWHATHTVQSCREACGGAGYLARNRFAALKADSDVFTTFEGDNVVLQQLVAKNLLTNYRDDFGELDPLGTAVFVAGQVWETVVERTAAREIVTRIADELRPSRDDDRDLLDREWQRELFAWREEHVISTAARRLKRGIDNGGDPFSVLIDAQDHVVLCAKVHGERLVLEAFDRAIARCPDPDTRELLDRLCSLYALWHVEADRGWFQEHGRLSSTRSKAVLKAVNTLCGELREHAGALVAAFGIPEQQLAEGIGRDS